MKEALICILTPRGSIDMMRDVHAAKKQRRPYVVVFVGVNGVGKSTNLVKVAYWLQQHKGATGHLLGAAEAVEAIFSVLAIHQGVAPLTLNVKNPDPSLTRVSRR